MGGGGGQQLHSLTPLQNLELGMVAGIFSKMINYPLLNWKNTVQQGLPISFAPAVVYRGLPMAMINLGGTTAVQFVATGFFQRSFRKIMGVEENSSTGRAAQAEIAGAAVGGLFSGIPCSIWELTMIQQQRFGGSLFQTPLRLAREYGLRSLSRGVITCCGRESLYTMAMLGICPLTQQELIKRYNVSPEIALGAGALIASCFAATLSHPLDTIKTCMQGDVAQLKYKGIKATAVSLSTEYGVAQGLFKGLFWRIGLITTTFFLVNKFKTVLQPVMF